MIDCLILREKDKSDREGKVGPWGLSDRLPGVVLARVCELETPAIVQELFATLVRGV